MSKVETFQAKVPGQKVRGPKRFEVKVENFPIQGSTSKRSEVNSENLPGPKGPRSEGFEVNVEKVRGPEGPRSKVETFQAQKVRGQI